MMFIANKDDAKLIRLANEEYILYRVPTDKLCGTCNEAISDIIEDKKTEDKKDERKVLIEFYRPKEKKKCPAIKQININKLMY
ncbi:hypothetical protein DW1_2486 [Proteiniborus sp. DW1]|uniref:hypothetical protein n=1 Tax=Proteiniborus sp. DW1 TaxID=1889883 RepID=UPI00092DED1F|nr:hypothetical protein [Proteiniborus sp. DW1]SCG84050.1 hypothetical protein DW1_2486 [Proteiniborus sp. DW1]